MDEGGGTDAYFPFRRRAYICSPRVGSGGVSFFLVGVAGARSFKADGCEDDFVAPFAAGYPFVMGVPKGVLSGDMLHSAAREPM